jgi:TPR repeat protein
MLGVMYFHGLGVSRDEAVAAIYFRHAAVQGDENAQLAFGSIHVRGVGVFQDLVEARMWLRLCSQATQPELSRQAASLLQLTAPLMTAEEISSADRRAERWRPVRPGFSRDPR